MSDDLWAQNGLLASVRFSVTAAACPGLLPRLLQPFAKRDIVPDVFEAHRVGDDLRVEIAVAAMPAEIVHLVEGNLRQIVGVTAVLRRQEVSGVVQRKAA